MGLSQSVFHPEFQAHHLAVVNSTHTATVRVERVLERGEWTPENGVGGDVLLRLYEGPAFISKMGAPSRADFVQDTVESQAVRVELDHGKQAEALPDDFKWHDNDRVTVLLNPDDTMLQGLQLYVHGWIGGSATWARNLICRTNTKQL